ncbi:hypothetical protein BJ165DRAFT_883798 [Panaeolus papilionaceus]|nr:hypothetical protein BJ165DRAFT_883798 [Panaeolus papilionaceus]
MSSATRPCLCPISQPCNCYNNNQQSSTPYASYVPYNQSASHYNHATPYNNTHHPYQQATLSTYIPTSYNPYHYIHYVPPTPLTPPTPLRDTTNVLTEAAEDSSSNKRKKPPGAIASTAKRSRLNPATSTTVPPAATTPNPNLPARSIPSPAAYGVGPVVHAPLPQSASSSTPHTPTFSCRVDNENVIPGSVLTPGPNQTDHGLASDVWYFTRGLKSKDKPMLLETPEKRLRERPDREIYSHLGCILCV